LHRSPRNARTDSEQRAASPDWAGPTAVQDSITEDDLHGEDLRLPLRVLLVEDSALLVQRISELVNALPFVRLEGNVNSEAAAIERLDGGGIDAIILDLQLHTGSGFGVLKALRKRGTMPPVIVFTNFAIAAYRDSALALGAAHFLDKSRDYDQLPSVLQEMSETAH
jgi:two-component system, OmpR family, response regulator